MDNDDLENADDRRANKLLSTDQRFDVCALFLIIGIATT